MGLAAYREAYLVAFPKNSLEDADRAYHQDIPTAVLPFLAALVQFAAGRWTRMPPRRIEILLQAEAATLARSPRLTSGHLAGWLTLMAACPDYDDARRLAMERLAWLGEDPRVRENAWWEPWQALPPWRGPLLWAAGLEPADDHAGLTDADLQAMGALRGWTWPPTLGRSS